jgi:hypothetical protein
MRRSSTSMTRRGLGGMFKSVFRHVGRRYGQGYNRPCLAQQRLSHRARDTQIPCRVEMRTNAWA